MKHMMRIFGFVLILAMAVPPTGMAYTDDIEIDILSAWEAAKDVLEEAGINKEDFKKKRLLSNWMYDEVRRTRKLVPLTKTGSIRRTFMRRYRIEVRLKEKKDNMIELKVVGKFQERPREARSQRPWKKIKPKSDDYDIERDYFFRVIKQIEQNIHEIKPQTGVPAATP